MTHTEQVLKRLQATADRPLTVGGRCNISGEITVQGSKNTANKLIAVTIARPGTYRIERFPCMLDALELLVILERLGGVVELDELTNVARIDTRTLKNVRISYELTRSTTGAFGFAGALLGRFGKVEIGKPGGDAIGPRPVDLHSEGFQKLGATVEESDTELRAVLDTVPDGIDFRMRMPSVGAAVNFVMTVAASAGWARLENVTYDRDIQTMYQLLTATGVQIHIQNNAVTIDARSTHENHDEIVFACSPDRNEAFTCLALGAMSRDGVTVKGLDVEDLASGFAVLQKLGVNIERKDEQSVRVSCPTQATRAVNDTHIIAGLSPLFHSDWAPLLEVVLTQVPGKSRIIDTLFSQRVRQAELLAQMGASIVISGGEPPAGVTLHWRNDPAAARYIIDIEGSTRLRAITTDVGYDVRACAAMVLAASQATGVSHLSDIRALYRGYEKVNERWTALGITLS